MTSVWDWGWGWGRGRERSDMGGGSWEGGRDGTQGGERDEEREGLPPLPRPWIQKLNQFAN